MKKNYVAKLGALALALSLMTTGMMGSTLAKYASEAVGTGSVAVAKWNIAFKADDKAPTENKIAFTLAETKNTNSNVSTDAVAPGDEGVIKYEITDEGTDVAYKCNVKVDTSKLAEGIQGVIGFYEDAGYSTKLGDEGISKTVAANAETADRGLTGNIYWRWETTNDAADTTVGTTEFTEANTKFTITLSAEQVVDTAEAP